MSPAGCLALWLSKTLHSFFACMRRASASGGCFCGCFSLLLLLVSSAATRLSSLYALPDGSRRRGEALAGRVSEYRSPVEYTQGRAMSRWSSRP